jgi:D-lactate dehydrogenase (cytochrome)
MIKLNSILKIRQKLVNTPLIKQYSSKVVPLTSERYSYLKRNNSYKALEDHDISYFKGILGETGILSNLKGSSELDIYNTDWYGVYKGSSSCVLFPNSTQQVSEILKYCNDKK